MFPVEIHRHIFEVYGEGVMNERNVRKWRRFFKEVGLMKVTRKGVGT
jgi:hypothetical protein